MARALIGQELVNNEDGNDSVSDDNCFSPNNDNDKEVVDRKAPPSLSVNREGNNMAVDDSPPDLNMAIMTPNAGREVSDKVKMRSRVMKDIYATAPEIEDDGFEPHLINWCYSYKKSICADVASCKQIYARSFQKALHSLLTNVPLVKEEKLSFPHAEDPTLPVPYPELQGNIDIDKLPRDLWWINTWEKRCKTDSNEILWSNHSYPTEHDSWHIQHLDSELLARCMGDYIFSPTGTRDKDDKFIDNLNNFHSGLCLVLSSAFTYFIGDTPQHDQLCGHYQAANTKMIWNMMMSKDKNGEDYQSVSLWNISNFTAPTMDQQGVNVEQYFRNVPHHRIHNGNTFAATSLMKITYLDVH
eukprot:jgi/Psemu1/24099/gm1.24099_g